MADSAEFDELFDESDRPAAEDLDAGGGYLLRLVSALEFLGRGDRHGLTVWDAIEEALRWWVAEAVSMVDGVMDPEAGELRWGERDPLRATLARFLVTAERNGVDSDVGFQQALRHWVTTMSVLHNGGQPWPHPREQSGFPPFVLPTHLT
jgi:hypothetical protein